MAIKRRVLMFLGIFIPFFAIFLMSQNTFAGSLSTGSLDLNWRASLNNNYAWSTGLVFNQDVVNTRQVRKYQFNSPSLTADGTNAVIHFETNVVYSYFVGNYGMGESPVATDNLPYMGITACVSNAGNISITGSSLSSATTYWYSNYDDPTTRRLNTTITFYGDVALKGFSKGSSGTITCAVGSNDYAFFDTLTSSSFIHFNGFKTYFEKNPASILWTDNSTELLLQQQIQQTQQMIQQQQTIIEQNNREFEQNQQAYDNISNQDTSDINGATNQETTNLIGILSSFLTELSSFTATNCSLSLPFPQFIGGTQTVNICQGKDVLGNFITIVGTLAMVAFYIPLTIVLLRMIYKEIRSFTNG